MFRSPLWIEWLKISPAGAELLLAQGVPGSPIHAGFAWVGVVEPWVEWEIDPSPVGAAGVLPQTLQPSPCARKRKAKSEKRYFFPCTAARHCP